MSGDVLLEEFEVDIIQVFEQQASNLNIFNRF